jgi:hypothetical protein
MKIFAIRDEENKPRKNLGFLFYYENEKQFFVELPENADPWETPLLLASSAERGEYTVGAKWSGLWVKQRIIPPDRQNIGQILRDNGMEEYDEYRLLTLATGRCAQDSCYISPVKEEDLPDEIKARFQRHVVSAVPLDGFRLLVFFRDGSVKLCCLQPAFQGNAAFGVLLRKEPLFYTVKVQAGGYGVAWDIALTVSCDSLYEMGQTIPLLAEDFAAFASHEVITTAEAADLLDCSRQNVGSLAKRGKLHPIKSSPSTALYWKSEVLNYRGK